MTAISEIAPERDGLIQGALPRIDYRDAFAAPLPAGRFAGIDELARAYFLAQPAWLRAISMNLPGRQALERQLAATTFAVGESIGSWRIWERGADEIVFGESLGFMTYRFSLALRRDEGGESLIAATVASTPGALGKAYFRVVRLLHKRFVRLTLRYALAAR
ncbi:MAG TPA: DUF2867 domain-containing protein [Herpetosiphonaceae bacterium]